MKRIKFKSQYVRAGMVLWVFHRETPWREGRFKAQSLVFNLVQSWFPTLVFRDGTTPGSFAK